MLLLDTCVLLWLAADQHSLSAAARAEISAHAGRLFVSAISAFEIGIKHQKGRLELPLPPEKWFALAKELHGLREVPVSGAIAARSASLPPLHADPCDRIIVATAQLHSFSIVSPDGLIHQYPGIKACW